MIIATAGHIDHGKTMLVKALTGVDTDTLPEEKSSGMSIDLGFAYCAVDHESTLGFIDVPGHERFIRNMIAGSTNIDFALLVIAADDGPMPQTKEHLDILTLLGVKRGAVAITKVDKVEQERLDEVTESTKKLIQETALSKAMIFPISNLITDSVKGLLSYLKSTSKTIHKASAPGNFRFAVDRVFIKKGFGTIVTGSIYSGMVSLGDKLAHFPQLGSLKVRGIENQNQYTEKVISGRRCALNITSSEVDLKNISRGDWILSPRISINTKRVDVRFRVSRREVKPAKHRARYHLHIGTRSVTCQIALLEGQEIAPGASNFAQLILDKPICTVYGDHFILRDISASRTLGGGKIIDSFAKAPGREKEYRIRWLESISQVDHGQALSKIVKISNNGLDLNKFSLTRNLTDDEARILFESQKMKVISKNNVSWGFSFNMWNSFLKAIIGVVENNNQEKPQGSGVKNYYIKEKVFKAVPRFVCEEAIRECVEMKKIKHSDGFLHSLSKHKKLNQEDQIYWQRIKIILLESKFTSPTIHDLASSLRVDKNRLETLFNQLCKMGSIIKINKDRYFLLEVLSELAIIAEEVASRHDSKYLNLHDFRSRAKIGRNLAIDILEFFDKIGLTMRTANGRLIKRPASETSIFRSIF